MTDGKKTVLLCISGGIAAYKSAYVASDLSKKGYDVHVLMTKNACEFVAPLTFETLTGNKACVDTFDRNFEFKTQHISLAKQADLVLVAPASADILAKLAHGIADDMVTTTILACTCPKIVSPAMNSAMYENPITQDNLETLRGYGFEVLDPAAGYLACGDIGPGRMPEPDILTEAVEHAISHEKDMAGLNVLVTAGPTRESLDPVRFITNHSSGKMGYALAKAAAARGANVTLVTGRTALTAPSFMDVVQVESAQDMFEEVVSRQQDMDIIIKAAAVADYRPASKADEKIKKDSAPVSDDPDIAMLLPMARTEDILKYLGEHRQGRQFLCGFSMETENMLENSRRKLERKHVDMICANSLRQEGAGFAGDTNVMTLISKDRETSLPLMSKDETATAILDEIMIVRNSETEG